MVVTTAIENSPAQWFLTRGGAPPRGSSVNFHRSASPYARPTTWEV